MFRLKEMQSSGQLTVCAVRVLELDETRDGIRATWSPSGRHGARTLDVGTIVNCTGPKSDVRQLQDPLWQSLLAQGLIAPDPHALGIRTGAFGALVGRDGASSPRLFCMGPMLRADHREATAVGELRAYADRLARHLSERDG